ncbi:MAG: serpin family protein, partial [Oscillospiraceae bacterium]|nr:serpin family protein [Oscillospiraceae bacterium]
GTADFSGMTNGELLVISEVIQAAKIICHEDGTEAAAATVVVFIEALAPIVLTVDRPFLYTIESPSGETLFMGVITDIN